MCIDLQVLMIIFFPVFPCVKFLKFILYWHTCLQWLAVDGIWGICSPTICPEKRASKLHQWHMQSEDRWAVFWIFSSTYNEFFWSEDELLVLECNQERQQRLITSLWNSTLASKGVFFFFFSFVVIQQIIKLFVSFIFLRDTDRSDQTQKKRKIYWL